MTARCRMEGPYIGGRSCDCDEAPGCKHRGSADDALWAIRKRELVRRKVPYFVAQAAAEKARSK